jgi:hypothetical protein
LRKSTINNYIFKSTVLKLVKEITDKNYPDLFNIQEISSDAIKGNIILEYLINNPEKSFQEGFDYSSKGNTFKNNWDSQFNTILNEIQENKINLIFVDKNFPPNALPNFDK